MTAKTERRRPFAPATTDVKLLTEADVRHLRLRWHNRFRADEVRAIIASYPGRSVWVPETLEYLLVGPWRHREEIAVILDLAAPRYTDAVVRAAVERCREAGVVALLAIEMDETRASSFYERLDFRMLDEVITYELARPTRGPDDGSLAFRAVDTGDETDMVALQRIDHAAFPWLWRNSAEEFATYARTPGVDLYLGWVDRQPVAYVGFTTYAGWGHLDRIAVDPGSQSQGCGRQSLQFVTNALVSRGARSIALSTQRDNLRSQRLYERFGFRRSRAHDYRLHGIELHSLNGSPLGED